MRDIFPFPPISALESAVQPLADYFGLFSLPPHIHEVLAAAIFYTAVQLVASPVISTAFFPDIYPRMSRAKKANWDAHVVSMVQSLLINSLALWCIFFDQERKNMVADWRERIWGYTGAAGMVQALAAGYFVWDLAITIRFLDVFGPGILAHAVSALAVFSFGFRPFLNYYGCNFILYELSTPFLNMHWFFDKLNMTGSKAQLYNGIALIVTFFSCRLVYGNYMSTWVYHDMWNAVREGPAVSASDSATGVMTYALGAGPIPMWLFVIYTTSNVVLNSLNVVWFFKMISAVRKRFVPGATAPPSREKVALEGKKPELSEASVSIAKSSAVADGPRLRSVAQ